MIIATKYIEDNQNYVTAFYKVVAPLYTAREINEMERSFLGVIKVCISPLNSQVLTDKSF